MLACKKTTSISCHSSEKCVSLPLTPFSAIILRFHRKGEHAYLNFGCFLLIAFFPSLGNKKKKFPTIARLNSTNPTTTTPGIDKMNRHNLSNLNGAIYFHLVATVWWRHDGVAGRRCKNDSYTFVLIPGRLGPRVVPFLWQTVVFVMISFSD